MILIKTTKYKLLLSFGIIGCWVGFNFFFFYPGKNGLGNFFNVTVIYLFTGYGALLAGILLLFLRGLGVLKSSESLVYVLVYTLNVCIFLLALAMYYTHSLDLPWLNRCLLNLLVGFLMLIDSFLLKKEVKA